MLKRILSILVVCSLLLGAIPAFAEETAEDGAIYEFEEKTYFGHTKSFYNHNFGKFQNFLKQLGIEYTIENDAPRGGRSGNHIVIVDKKLAEEVYNQFSAEY